MTRRAILASGAAVAMLVGAAFVFSRRGPAPLVVDIGVAARKATLRSTVTASGEIVATRYADIGSSVMGKVVALPVTEGIRVRSGQVLARIDAVQAESDLRSASELSRALVADEQAATEASRSARADIAAAEARAREADQRLARARSLAADGLTPASDLDAARAGADAAMAQLQAAQAAAARAEQQVTASSRRVAQARAQQARADDVVAKTSIISPIDGVVTRLRVREGEMVVVGLQNQPGTTLMTVSDLGTIDAEVKVAEADVLRLALNQPAEVTLEALPGKRFRGRVVEIGASALPSAGAAAAAREFKVAVRLDNPDPGLRPGLTCDAEIVTAERANVLTVPLQSVVLRQDGQGTERSGVFVAKDGFARFTPVTSGAIGGLDIEIDGVPESAPIITGPYQILRELQDGARVRSAAAER